MTVILVLLGMASLMALGNYMNQKQEEAMSLSGNPIRQQELKKEVRNRQGKYMLWSIAGICVVIGIASVVRRRKQHENHYADPSISVVVTNGNLQATGIFQKLELCNLKGQVICSTTHSSLSLPPGKNGQFLLYVQTDDGDFCWPLYLKNNNEVRRRPEHWSKTEIEYHCS